MYLLVQYNVMYIQHVANNTNTQVTDYINSYIQGHSPQLLKIGNISPSLGQCILFMGTSPNSFSQASWVRSQSPLEAGVMVVPPPTLPTQ